MTTWIALVIVALGSYLFRFAPLVLLERVAIPQPLERALAYAGPSAMAALMASALLGNSDLTGTPTTSLVTVIALVVAGGLAMVRRPFLLAVGSALAVFALLDAAFL